MFLAQTMVGSCKVLSGPSIQRLNVDEEKSKEVDTGLSNGRSNHKPKEKNVKSFVVETYEAG